MSAVFIKMHMFESEILEYELIAPGCLYGTEKCLILALLGQKRLIPPEVPNVV